MAFPNIFSPFYSSKKEIKEKEIKTIVIQEESMGSSGTDIYSGYYNEEYLNTLQGRDRAIEFDKMRRSDAQIKMLLSATKYPIVGAKTEIIPAGDSDEFRNHATLCEHVIKNDIDETRFLKEALTFEEFGFSLFEKTHKINTGVPISDKDGNIVLSSYIGIKKLGWLSPKTIEKWNFNKENKELESVQQTSYGDLAVNYDHPVRHLIIMTMELEGDNYEGISMLRNIYGNYLRKKVYHKLNAAGIEKSMPIPTAEIPIGRETTKEFTTLKEVLKKFTTHQQNYLTYPSGWNIKLNNGTAYDPSKLEASIDKEDIRMSKAFLANFLELGLSGTGAFALSNDLSDFFLSGLKYIAGIIEKEVDKIFKELVILNFGPQTKYPTYKFTGIQDKVGEELAKIIEMFSRNKIITPDDDLEDHLRKRFDLPKRSDKGVREVQSFPGNSVNYPQKKPETLSEKVNSILFGEK